MESTTPALHLSINQRNLYRYYLNHKSKYKDRPCYVPMLSTQSLNLDSYLKTLASLEKKQLITVDRSGGAYTSWIIKDPENNQ